MATNFHQPRLRKQSSIVPELGMEGQIISRDCFKDHRIAVLTSGGDSQGMNSAVRAVVRMGIYCGCKVYTVKEGYQGLVDGAENIVETGWADVSGIMHLGGTTIGSARCKDFRTVEGRQKAALNMLRKGITNLVVIGGDGSLTGANLFREEWPNLLASLKNKGEITNDDITSYGRLNVVGLVGSIDNDFCGTDMTIGTDTALHRIVEACDAISSTASSHKRCFVLEVMGRHCGYLALVAALVSEAEWVFIPEMPPDEGWEEKMCNKLLSNEEVGQRVNIVIVAEGAKDIHGNSITVNDVKELISKKVKLDTRVTVLGHVQRGGSPSAFDRVLGIRMGAEAVLALMDMDIHPKKDAVVIGINGNQTVRVKMMKCVSKTQEVAEAMANKDFEKAVTIRGKSFQNNLTTYKVLSKLRAPKDITQKDKLIAILNVGAPACGMNAVMRTFTRLMICQGYTVIGYNEGFNGMVNDTYENMTWKKVRRWVGAGGCNLGLKRDTPEKIGMDKVCDAVVRSKLSGLFIIGGFEAFLSALQLYKARDEYPALNIPVLCIPATISNNVPGSEFSLGADTSLNEITRIVDKIKQSAVGTKRRVFVVETQGGFCGYLATMSGLAGGADAAYIYEEKFGIDDLRQDVKHIRAKIADNVQRGLILVNENANANYNTDFIYRLFAEEGRGIFDARINVPGHLQQGGAPSPFDRNMGIKFGSKASEWFHNHFTSDATNIQKETACLLGLQRSEYCFTPVIDLESDADFKKRMPEKEWWLSLRPLMRIMAKHESLYASEIIRH